MARKSKANQIVWSISRYEHSARYSSAEVLVRLHNVGDDNMYDYIVILRAVVDGGDAFSENREAYCHIACVDMDLAARQIAVATEFIGGGEITIGKLKAALARFDEGFFDTRTGRWEHKGKASMRVFEPCLWSDDADVQHLSRIFARSEEDAQNIVTLALVNCNRLDLLRDWISRDMALYELTSYNEAFIPADFDAIFAPCPDNLVEEVAEQ